MRALLQRVTSASVLLPSGEKRAIGPGLVIYLGVGKGDDEKAAKWTAEKCVNLRIFSNDQGKFDKSLLDVQGEALIISQFTLYGDPTAGRRPDFGGAMPPAEAIPLYERFVSLVQGLGVGVQTGEFAAHMKIESVNDGPVSIWVQSPLI
jgi:D-aminoacyl-tRNA deacylase